MYEIEEGESQTHEASVHESGNTCVMQASYMKTGVSFSFYLDTYLHGSFRLAFQEMPRSFLTGEKEGEAQAEGKRGPTAQLGNCWEWPSNTKMINVKKGSNLKICPILWLVENSWALPYIFYQR